MVLFPQNQTGIVFAMEMYKELNKYIVYKTTIYKTFLRFQSLSQAIFRIMDQKLKTDQNPQNYSLILLLVKCIIRLC